MHSALYIGLMSGTSIDAVDCALLQFIDEDFSLAATYQHPIPDATRQAIAALSHSGDGEIERMGALDRQLGQLFSNATMAMLTAHRLRPEQIAAIGSHGQTVRHRPPSGASGDDIPFTLQIGDPNTIAERTGITTVADFRRRDIAAGGEGAPLAPAFHAAAFAAVGRQRTIVNIGGMANASILDGNTLLQGFDTGPGNTLLDHWIARHAAKPYDDHGVWAASGKVDRALLSRLLSHPYFAQTGPRSTGREAFHLDWLDTQPGIADGTLRPADVQATLAELTAVSISRALANCPVAVQEVYICGGGAHNTHLINRLERILAPVSVQTTQALGLDPDWVEAAAFAWLAHRTMNGLSGNSPAVTGAGDFRVLGGIFPGNNRLQ